MLYLINLLIATQLNAQELSILELNEFSMESWRIGDFHDSYTEYGQPKSESEQEKWYGGAAANFNLDIIKYDSYSLYWDNHVFMNGTDKQVRHTGWQWEAGIGLWSKLDLFWFHKSQHVLDEAYEDKHYPLENRYGFRYTFFKKN